MLLNSVTLQLVLISLLVSSSMDCKNSSKDPFEMRKYKKTHYCLILLSLYTVNEKIFLMAILIKGILSYSPILSSSPEEEQTKVVDLT